MKRPRFPQRTKHRSSSVNRAAKNWVQTAQLTSGSSGSLLVGFFRMATEPTPKPKIEPNERGLLGLPKRFESLEKFIGLLLGLVLAFFAGRAWVENTARNAVLDEKYLTTLSGRVRPVCIFDSNGSIETDLGASDYIEDIKVTPNPPVFGFDVTVKAKRHLAYPPLIIGVNANLFQEKAIRRKMNDWNILMTPNSPISGAIIGEGGGFPTNYVYRFKLEILH